VSELQFRNAPLPIDLAAGRLTYPSEILLANAFDPIEVATARLMAVRLKLITNASSETLINAGAVIELSMLHANA
jgi:hypothetical protein